MIERLKRKLRHNDDHGSSFVLVIVATTFMCILASAILMGAMMTYKLKFYKLNSLNNFYEVETALDEMYAMSTFIQRTQLRLNWLLCMILRLRRILPLTINRQMSFSKSFS